MRTQLAAELDELIATYIMNMKPREHEKMPSEKFPHVFKLMDALKDMERTST